MKNKLKAIKSWFNSAAGKISIVLFFSSIILILFALFLSMNDESFSPYSFTISIILGLATNISSIIVTTTFVQNQIDKQTKEINDIEEGTKIIRFNRVLHTYLREYSFCYYCVTVPSERRTNDIPLKLNVDFCFKDLKDLHKPAYYTTAPIIKSSIELFFKAEKDLLNYINRMIEEIDFNYHFEVLKVLLELTRVGTNASFRDCILENEILISKDINGNSKKEMEYIREMIDEDDKYNWIETLKDKSNSNAMGPYVNLFHTLKTEGNLINQYLKLIKEV